ncbi:cytochrome-c peroxidase [Flavobacterium sp. '19STA2R22 D10 B1']|uniref:cytochrome-c peroxidase n=1 Tax=Flavobacterium aerium TaxID=3037261 RepID=UPI00278C5AE1|nr:cytochrome c peroxidase [Flavobacterium sp. '19STA2R22 D10 B1']
MYIFQPKIKKTTIILLGVFFCLCSCQKKENHAEQINSLFKKDILSLTKSINDFEKAVKSNSNNSQIQQQFLLARQGYKKVEMLNEYYFPNVAKSINGPALDEFEENDNKVIPPEGFQVIEELLFPTYDSSNQAELLVQIGILSGNLKRLSKMSETTILTDAQIFEAMRLELFRIVTLGITGFDAPIAQNSIIEAHSALQNMESYYKIYADNNTQGPFKSTLQLFEKGKTILESSKNFNDFNRAKFILEIANPLGFAIAETKSYFNITSPIEKTPLKASATQLFGSNVFDVDAFSAFPDYETTPEKIALGKVLFNDPILSKNNSRSCASCHHADKAFTDGQTTSLTLDGKSFIKRNTPTILNIGYQRAYFSDSRVAYLEDQALDVIANKDEMHGSVDNAVIEINKNKEYTSKFQKAFPNRKIDGFAIKNSLASYIRSLSNYNSKFDVHMSGKKLVMNSTEVAGFNLFTGKAKCATCHFIPLTNGTVPPHFNKSESEVLGVPNKWNKLDNDLGKYNLTQADMHKYSFKTPTIRNIALTAPYMHNGVYNTLEEVMDFYNEGGGNAKGYNLPNQTLPEDKLNLSKTEINQLIAFMKTLTDTQYQN